MMMGWIAEKTDSHSTKNIADTILSFRSSAGYSLYAP